MSLDRLDDYITTDHADRETCEEHHRLRSCRECRLEMEEYEAEYHREERADVSSHRSRRGGPL